MLCGELELDRHCTGEARGEPSKLLRAQDGRNWRDGGVNGGSSTSSEALLSLREIESPLDRR